ncbi:hypothetical protein KIW84_025035 [Lathyrus oleraceus]|uniref:Copia protein n=1 Tax=Pisum sativum TaxID=3888 RepID=A0A9D4YLP8_PEA|nr:hypothetical protein KIW84_025035 [Pisum sativum]
MMRYWNGEEVFKKLGLAIGILPTTREATVAFENPRLEETKDVGNEDELIVHLTASVGDLEGLEVVLAFGADKHEEIQREGLLCILLVVTVSSRKQGIITLSSCDGEYVAASYAICQVMFIEMLLKELKVMEHEKMKLFVDNKSAIDLANHPMSHVISKHIEGRYHFLRDQVNIGKFKLEHWRSQVQLADRLTKSLNKTKFGELKELIGIRSLENMN